MTFCVPPPQWSPTLQAKYRTLSLRPTKDDVQFLVERKRSLSDGRTTADSKPIHQSINRRELDPQRN